MMNPSVQTISAQEITLHQLSETFGLVRSDEAQFFPEWQDNLPELSPVERQWLDQVKDDYLHLSQYPMLEPIVKMLVLSPLLSVAGFYRSPFYLAAEHEVRITSQDNGTTVRGKIDILICQPQFWITVIEAKRAEYSLKVGIPQALAYMMAHPQPEKPAFGLVMNGTEFIFIKLSQQPTPHYSFSNEFSVLNQGNELYRVAGILKKLGQIAQSLN
jgi:hypothetical protein